MLERALKESGLSYAILRPNVLFGKEDILINNIAWTLRKLPVFGVFGDGQYRLQPLHVDDFAALAVEQGKDRTNRVIDAIGQGKRAATAIDNYLNGRPVNAFLHAPEKRTNPLADSDLERLRKEIRKTPRVVPSEIPAADRVHGFAEVEAIYSEEEARAEAQRCLKCGICSECYQCVTACLAGAVNHSMKPKERVLDVGAIILAPGFTLNTHPFELNQH